MKLIYSLFLFISGALLLQSCEIINPEEEIPSYITIDSIALVANGTNTEGELTHNLVDCWVYVNDNAIGAYELPATIPVLNSGNVTIKLGAGIKVDGLSANRLEYPFLDFYREEVKLTKGSTAKIKPDFQYYSTSDFKWIEDFENSSLSIDTSKNSTAGIKLTSDSVDIRSGFYSGKIELTEDNDYFEAYSNLIYSLPNNKPVFLEIDYKTEETILISSVAYYIDGSSYENSLVGITPKVNENGEAIWNKVYVELTYEASAGYNINALGFRFGISSLLSGSKSSAKVLIDNIKLVTRE